MSPFRAQLPGARVVGETLSAARRRTTVATRGLAVPEAFASATTAAYALVLAKPAKLRSAANKRDLRRLARQEAALGRGAP